MVRRWAVVLASLTLLVSTSVPALGLGDINVRSGLNQPLNAEIELLSVTPEELDTLAVTLASQEAFEQAGIERPFELTQLRFETGQRNGKAYLRVYTQEPVKEPFLNYLIEVNWPSGHLLREYTVLLDPPALAAQQTPIASAVESTAEAVDDSRPADDSTGVSDTTASAPATESVTPPSVDTEAATATAQTAPSTQPDGTYGPTRAGEGLWGVAARLRPDASITVQQMMLALLKANPDAFLTDNVNSLKAGYNLRVPEVNEIETLTQEQAIGVIKQHNTVWKNTYPPVAKAVQPVVDPVPVAAESTPPAPDTAPAPEDTQAASPQLKLVAPLEEKTAGLAPGADTQQTQAQANPARDAEKQANELTLANEALEAKTQENDELRSRMTELEKQTASILRLMQLKDEELASMQAKLSALEAAQTSPPAVPATPATEAASEAVETAETTSQPEAEQPQPAAAPSQPLLTLPPPSLTEQLTAGLRAVWTEIRNNPLAQAMVAVVALLVLSLLWVVNRRRRINNEVIEAAVYEPITPGSEVRPPAEHAIEEPQAEPVAVDQAKASEADLVAEANVYLAYERYSQAEERLRLALSTAPDRHEIQLKLLEIYHITQDKNAFVTQAESLHNALAGHEENPLWSKARAMGKEICPEHPLFGGGDHTPDSAMLASVAGTASVANTADVPVDGESLTGESDWLGTSPALSEAAPEPQAIVERSDFNNVSLDANAAGWAEQPKIADREESGDLEWPGAPEPVAKTVLADEDALAAFDLTDIQSELEAGLAQQAAAPLEPRVPDADPDATRELENIDPPASPGLDYYSLDFNLSKEADLLAQANAELASPTMLDSDLDMDADLLTSADEVGTKLDLARAYIEMGDPEGAQSILDEVLKEGTESQKHEAQELLLQVS